MTIPQQKLREAVFQFLYGYDMGKPDEEDFIELLATELKISKKILIEAQQKVKQILTKLPEIDALITQASTSYNFERIYSVERNILRLGIYEMLYDDSIPPKVAIAEALRLAKKFGTDESKVFVNAIMDALLKQHGEKKDGSSL